MIRIACSWRWRLSAFGLVVLAAFAALGWEPPPWEGRVRVCRSPVHRADIPHEKGMRVKDALARSRNRLGEMGGEKVAVYRWRLWLPERILDAAVMGGQNALAAAGLHGWSATLWQRWDELVPRQPAWQEVKHSGDARDWMLESGEMVVLQCAR